MANLVEFDALKNVLELTKTETDYPALTELRDSVKTALESYTGRIFDPGEHTKETYIITGTKLVGLPALPVKSVISVTLDGVSTTGYKVSNFGLIMDNEVANKQLKVVYEGGLENVPAELKRAALLQTAYEYQSHDHIGARSVSNTGGSVSRPALGILDEVERLIGPFRHPLERIF